MTQEELMIGNWVAYKNDFPNKHLQGMIGTVVGIAGRIDIRTTDGKFHDSEHPNWLQPVPLTKEILDKNFRGYPQRYNGWNDVIYYDVKDEYEIHLTGNDVSLNINYDDSEHAAHDKIYLFDLPYVHTLQHALRLIGYDKEVII